MSRDLLLALLTIALLLNLAFLVQVANLRWQRKGDARPSRHVRAEAERTFFGPTARGAEARVAAPTTAEPLTSPSAAQPHERAGAVEAVAEPALSSQPAADSEPSSAQDDGVEASPRPARRGGRARRFVLPPLDEDHARSARAIEAFLGGPPPTEVASERPHRRRHRARRTAGTPVPRTSMLVWLQGFGELDRMLGPARGASVSTAFLDALRRAARTGDEVREVARGRARVVVEADDAGASAFLDRARTDMQPWLDLLAVPVRLEAGQRESTGVISIDDARRVVGNR